MRTQMLTAFKFLLIMTLLTGIVYPVFVTGIAQIAFPGKASGSLLRKDGKITGSELIGQKFNSPAYFWSRPSATDYHPVPSGASNLGPTSTELSELVNERRKTFVTGNNIPDTATLPAEMIFASGSGLDPHISVDAALMQVKRIVRIRQLNSNQAREIYNLIGKNTEKPQYGLLGKERINVFLLNTELDEIK
jgi:potassium-transporting ATPase KdpC subunit